MDERPPTSIRSGLAVWVASLASIVAIGVFDYASGTELRVYPLYYAPVSALAWRSGHLGAIVASVIGAGSWAVSNVLAGLEFSGSALWIVNTTVHGVSFLFVGFLVATLHRSVVDARTLARVDPLTGLRNSRAFYEDTGPLLELCRRQRRPVTVAYVDLDGFKGVNDRKGHAEGDALLRDVAAAILRTVRPTDLSGRLGGDEFALVLPELSETDASAVLERLRESINAAAEKRGTEVTASLGALTFSAAPSDLETLIHEADALMYASKAAGRNRVTLEVVRVRPEGNGSFTRESVKSQSDRAQGGAGGWL